MFKGRAAAGPGWHLDTLAGAPSARDVVIRPRSPRDALRPGGSQRGDVQVALVDGPTSTIGVDVNRLARGHAPLSIGKIDHPHADAVAALIRQQADEGVELKAYTGLADGAAGVGTPITAVARALSDALQRGPQIVNLSLGWPPEMGYPALLRNTEGPFEAAPPTGQVQSCEGADVAVSPGGSVAFDNRGQPELCAASCGADGAPDDGIRLDIQQPSVLTARVVSTVNGFDSVMHLHEVVAAGAGGADVAEVACNDDHQVFDLPYALHSAFRVGVERGDYLLFVEGYAGARGQGRLDIEVQPVCQIVEDPAGEAVRDLLADAGETLVVAAAGNRVGRIPVAEGERALDAGVGAVRGTFFPAAWRFVPYRADGVWVHLEHVLPVGAYGPRPTPPLGEAPLNAPGVRIDLGALGGPDGLLEGRLGRTITGTSAAAALTTGWIAATARANGQRPLDVGRWLLDHGASCPDVGSGRFLGECPRAPAVAAEPDFEPEITLAGGGALGQQPPADAAPLDRHATAGLGPQPDIDPCDDDCYLALSRDAVKGDALLQLDFGLKAVVLDTLAIEFRSKRGTRYATLPGHVASELNKALALERDPSAKGTQYGRVKASIEGVPLPADFGADTAVWFAYDVIIDGKQQTRRRSPLGVLRR